MPVGRGVAHVVGPLPNDGLGPLHPPDDGLFELVDEPAGEDQPRKALWERALVLEVLPADGEARDGAGFCPLSDSVNRRQQVLGGRS